MLNRKEQKILFQSRLPTKSSVPMPADQGQLLLLGISRCVRRCGRNRGRQAAVHVLYVGFLRNGPFSMAKSFKSFTDVGLVQVEVKIWLCRWQGSTTLK